MFLGLFTLPSPLISFPNALSTTPSAVFPLCALPLCVVVDVILSFRSLFVLCFIFQLLCRGWGRSTTAPSGPWSRPTSTMSWDSMRSQVPSACCPLLARVCLSTLKKDLALSLRWIWTACSHKLIHCYVMHICLSYINETGKKQVS